MNKFESNSSQYLSMSDSSFHQLDSIKFAMSVWVTLGIKLPKWKLLLVRVIMGKKSFAQFNRLCRMHIRDLKTFNELAEHKE